MPQGFRDNSGRVWDVSVSVATVKRVKAAIDVNLLDVVDQSLVEKILRDPLLLADILWAVCRPQADAQGITAEDFLESLGGDALDGATRALLEAIVNFSPSPRDRATLRKILDATFRTMERARDLIDEQLTDAKIRKVSEAALASVRNSSSSVPASSG